MFANIQGYTLNGGTIPRHIVTSAEKPDIVCVNSSSKTVSNQELNVPFETNLDNARQYKTNKCPNLVSDIQTIGYKCDLVCFKVGSLGLVSSGRKGQFKRTAKIAKTK